MIHKISRLIVNNDFWLYTVLFDPSFMSQKPSCKTLQEVLEHPATGQTLALFHSVNRDPRFEAAPIERLLNDVAFFRAAMKHFFEVHPFWDTPEVRDGFKHVLELMKEGDPFPERYRLDAHQHHQADLPSDLLTETTGASEELLQLEKRGITFEAECGPLTQHSKFFDSAVIPWIAHDYSFNRHDTPTSGPRPRFAELLKNSMLLLSSFGEYVRAHFEGVQLIDIAAGRTDSIPAWASLFGAKACLSIDHNYPGSTREKRGDMDWYRLSGDMLEVIDRLPDHCGSFHVAGLQFSARSEHSPYAREYMEFLTRLVFQKTAPGGLFLVGKIHCDVDDESVQKAGFVPVELPRLLRGLECFTAEDWRAKYYTIYQKARD